MSMSINVFAKSVTTFEKFQEAVRTSGHPLTDAEAKKAATRFTVPLIRLRRLFTLPGPTGTSITLIGSGWIFLASHSKTFVGGVGPKRFIRKT